MGNKANVQFTMAELNLLIRILDYERRMNLIVENSKELVRLEDIQNRLSRAHSML